MGFELDCCLGGVAGATCVSASCPGPEDPPSRLHRLKDCLDALEEERRKIDAFRRELPLCMQLLHEAIESYKEKLGACAGFASDWHLAPMQAPLNDSHSYLADQGDRNAASGLNPAKKTLELPLTLNPKDDLLLRSICKPDWMAMPASFQGESCSHSQEECHTNPAEKVSRQHSSDQIFTASSKPLFHSRTKSGGAFTPFSRDRHLVQPTARPRSLDPADLAVSREDYGANPSCTLAIPVKSKPQGLTVEDCRDLSVKGAMEAANSAGQSSRKTRRCWSPELHRRFVNALEQLGGSQVATPKQIRELMKVDGLTNDEVKSHLQKYRLHTRRPNPTQNVPAQTPQVVVLGGIWVPPEYSVHAAAHQAPGLYNTSQQSLPCQAASSQEFCSEMGSVEQMNFDCRRVAPAQSSQSSLQGSSQLAGRSSPALHEFADTGREESACDDEDSNNSSCKGGQWRRRAQEMSEQADDRSQGDSDSGFQSHCTSEEEEGFGRK